MKKKAKKSRKSSPKSKSVSKSAKEGILPLGDRVLVRPFTEAELKNSAAKKPTLDFILPDSMTKEKSAQGKVLAVGETKIVKVGDIVLFSKYAYDEVSMNGEDLYLLKEEHLLAIIK